MVRIEGHSSDIAVEFQALKHTYGEANPVSGSDMLADFKSAQVLVDPGGAKRGPQSCSPNRHPPWKHCIQTRQAREDKEAQGCLSGSCMTKLSLNQVHGKAEAKFKLTLLFHSKICRQTRRLPIKDAIGKNQDQIK